MRYISDDRVDSSSRSTQTIQVIAAGLPRCATTSLQAALESDVFGLTPCVHMADIMPYPARLQLVIDAMREDNRTKRHKLLYEIFSGYAATADFPGTMFTADLMDMYPTAAIVLNQRKNGREWVDSAWASIGFARRWWFLPICGLWKTDRLLWNIHRVSRPLLERQFGNGEMFCEDYYYKYNEMVKAEAKKRGREVLEWQAGDGWEPLCRFLGRPVPKDGRQFPHLNDAATMKWLQRALIARGLVSWAALGVAIWAGWTYSPGLVAKMLRVVQGGSYK